MSVRHVTRISSWSSIALTLITLAACELDTAGTLDPGFDSGAPTERGGMSDGATWGMTESSDDLDAVGVEADGAGPDGEASPGSDASAPDASGADDGGTPDGSLKIPGEVDCGAVTCTAGFFCCIYANKPSTCQAAGTPCIKGQDIHCDGADDCPGQKCCGELGGYSGHHYYKRTSCESHCNAQEHVMCDDTRDACWSGKCRTSPVEPSLSICD